MTFIEFNKLDDSLESFQFIKMKSEELWEKIELEECWGYQIQENSKWNKGLTENELHDFQEKIGFNFSEGLKNYFRTMNGLDTLGINNHGGEGEVAYGTTFYKYPNDIEEIKDTILWIEKSNINKDNSELINSRPSIFPYYAHRCLILNSEQLVLSMFGDDIIYWAKNLSKGVATDIFGSHNFYNEKDVPVMPNDFWCQKV